MCIPNLNKLKTSKWMLVVSFIVLVGGSFDLNAQYRWPASFTGTDVPNNTLTGSNEIMYFTIDNTSSEKAELEQNRLLNVDIEGGDPVFSADEVNDRLPAGNCRIDIHLVYGMKLKFRSVQGCQLKPHEAEILKRSNYLFHAS